MGLLIRDDRQMKALTGLSQAQFDHLLPVFSAIYQAPQQQAYEKGVALRHETASPWRWLQRETANDGGYIAVCPLLLQDVSHL